MMVHVSSFSTGLSSALATERMLDRYGKENCRIVAMDTLNEEPDNWRFAKECETMWGVEIEILTEGRNPLEVAEDHQIIPNQKIHPCTFELKIDPFREWIEQFTVPITIHIGYDIFEMHRCDRTKKAYNEAGYLVDFPLLWKPIEPRPYPRVVREDWGIEPPYTYDLGFPHANCMQRGCFQWGQGDWIRYLINFPDRYAETEAWEQRMRDHPTRQNYAICRDQSNGTVTPLTLTELRERYESDNSKQMSFFDERSQACQYCGVGDLLTAQQGRR